MSVTSYTKAKLDELLLALSTTLSGKADSAALVDGLAGKVNSSTFTTGLAAKADAAATATALASKADAAATSSALAGKASTASLATVATTGAYADLVGKPTIPPAFTAEEAQDAAAALLTAGTHTGISFSYDDAAGSLAAAVNTGGSALTLSATQTAPYVAKVGEIAMMNVPSGATTLTLPSNPANRAQVGFRSLGATTAVPLTIVRGGTDTIGDGGATSVVEPLSGVTRIYQFDSPSKRWLPVSDVKPLTALDGRFGDAAVAGLVGAPATATGVALRAAFVSGEAPGPTRSAWGHSLVQGITGGAAPWTPVLAALLGLTVNNYGIGGQFAAQVAARQGGKPAIISTATGSLPASGSVAVTMDVDFLGTGTSSIGKIAGVPGTLTRTGTAVGTFARTTAGSAVPIPGGAPFIADPAAASRHDVTYLWPGRNDLLITPVTDVVESVGRMIGSLDPGARRVLILEEPPTVTEITGSGNRTALNTLNDAIRAAFPASWVPICQWLRTQEAASAAGIVFNAADRTDIANGVTPAVFRADTLHLSTAANRAVAWRLYQEEVRRGWVLPTAAVPAVSPYAADDFTRADGALGTTPQGEYTWATLQGVGLVIASNQAGPAATPTASSISGFAVAVTDGIISATLPVVLTTSGQLAGLYFRGDAAGTGYVFYRQGGVGAAAVWKLSRKTTSVFTDLATGTGAQAAGEKLSARVQGSTITCYLDGVQVAQVTDATYTNTRVGLFMYGTSTAPRIDDFSWAPLA